MKTTKRPDDGRSRKAASILLLVPGSASPDFARYLALLMTRCGPVKMPKVKPSETGYGSGISMTSARALFPMRGNY